MKIIKLVPKGRARSSLGVFFPKIFISIIISISIINIQNAKKFFAFVILAPPVFFHLEPQRHLLYPWASAAGNLENLLDHERDSNPKNVFKNKFCFFA